MPLRAQQSHQEAAATGASAPATKAGVPANNQPHSPGQALHPPTQHQNQPLAAPCSLAFCTSTPTTAQQPQAPQQQPRGAPPHLPVRPLPEGQFQVALQLLQRREDCAPRGGAEDAQPVGVATGQGGRAAAAHESGGGRHKEPAAEHAGSRQGRSSSSSGKSRPLPPPQAVANPGAGLTHLDPWLDRSQPITAHHTSPHPSTTSPPPPCQRKIGRMTPVRARDARSACTPPQPRL